MQIITNNLKLWLHGLFAAGISAFASSASGFLVLPNIFNFSHDGMLNMLRVSIVPALIAVFAYLKQSPLPPLNPLGPGDVVTVKNPVVTPDTISGSSATLTKASPENGQK